MNALFSHSVVVLVGTIPISQLSSSLTALSVLDETELPAANAVSWLKGNTSLDMLGIGHRGRTALSAPLVKALCTMARHHQLTCIEVGSVSWPELAAVTSALIGHRSLTRLSLCTCDVT